VKGARVRDRRVADRALRRLLVEIDEGRADQSRPKMITFDDWADQYLERLETVSERKATTVRAYKSTLGYARPVLGGLNLTDIGQGEIDRVVRAIRKSKATDATLSKHLRHLSAIFTAAVDDEKLDRNPVSRKFKRDLRLRVPSGTPPFTDAELAALWAALAALKTEDVYVAVAKAATVTGCRVGELCALTWDDLNLTNRTLRIRFTYNGLGALTLPKDGEARTVNLIPPAVALFEQWTAAKGVMPGPSPIFVAPRSGERLNANYLGKILTAAIEQAGIPKAGEDGRPRKPLHSLRASYTRLMLEQGRAPQWVQAQLGHSDANLTLNVYGKWTEEAMRAEADELPGEGFPV
jgi:integrase